MQRYSEYRDGEPKSGGAYTGWRPREPMPRLGQYAVGLLICGLVCYIVLCMVVS